MKAEIDTLRQYQIAVLCFTKQVTAGPAGQLHFWQSSNLHLTLSLITFHLQKARRKRQGQNHVFYPSSPGIKQGIAPEIKQGIDRLSIQHQNLSSTAKRREKISCKKKADLPPTPTRVRK